MIKTGSLVEEQRVEVTRTSYKNYNVGDSIKIHGKTKIGHVAGKVNDPKTGEQAYIVTPNNPKSKNFDPKKVKNVTVLLLFTITAISGWMKFLVTLLFSY